MWGNYAVVASLKTEEIMIKKRSDLYIYKAILFIAILLLLGSCSKANVSYDVSPHLSQKEKDSLTIQNAEWDETTIKEGVVLKKVSIELFNSDQMIYVVEVDTVVANVDFAVTVEEGYALTSEQAKNHDAIVAINGTYGFGDYSSNNSRHFVKVDNVVKYHTQDREFDTRATGVITVTNNFVDIADWNRTKELQNAGSAEYAIVSGPLIIDDGENQDMWEANFVYDRNPRTFMALKEGHVVMGVVDGRNSARDGMSLFELRYFAKELGYTDLINLDGGGSSTLYVKNYSVNGIVNVPSDGTERKIKSVFYIKSKSL